jgi:hypothetical protein
MISLNNFRFSIWTDGRYDMCSIQADVDESESGLRWIWFVFTRLEFEAIAAGKTSTAADGYHKLDVCEDLWTFFNLEMPRASSGVVHVPYYRANIPRTFVKILARLTRRVWSMQRTYGTNENRGDKVILEFDAAYRARICRLYGQGKGLVDWRTQLETHERIDALAREDKGFAQRLEQIETIARNTTRGFHERAAVSISKDGHGFFWSAIDPRGCSVLHGGLINHARDGGHDWSLHT